MGLKQQLHLTRSNITPGPLRTEPVPFCPHCSRKPMTLWECTTGVLVCRLHTHTHTHIYKYTREPGAWKLNPLSPMKLYGPLESWHRAGLLLAGWHCHCLAGSRGEGVEHNGLSLLGEMWEV